ncbi:MAG: TIGR02147 family protein [Fibrobacteres bacterium]|nr:TIGR02147 family protein [Fibrobacterota bacterium]
MVESLRGNPATPSMHEIFEYSNYRKFLSDLYAVRKAANPAISYRYLAQKAGFASPSFIGKILSGETNISHQTLLRLVDVFQLAGPEAEYFELLVYYDLARTELDKKHYFQRMNALRSRHGHPTDASAVLHSAWYVPPLLTLIDLGLFHGNYADLGRMVTPPITAQESRLGVESLIMSGHVRKEESGKYIVQVRSKPANPPSSHPFEPTQDPVDEASVTRLMATLPKATPSDLTGRIHQLRDELMGLLRRAHQSGESSR